MPHFLVYLVSRVIPSFSGNLLVFSFIYILLSISPKSRVHYFLTVSTQTLWCLHEAKICRHQNPLNAHLLFRTCLNSVQKLKPGCFLSPVICALKKRWPRPLTFHYSLYITVLSFSEKFSNIDAHVTAQMLLFGLSSKFNILTPSLLIFYSVIFLLSFLI